VPVSPRLDLVLAGTPGAARLPAVVPGVVPGVYTGGAGRLVVLRGSPYRRAADLAGKPVCMALGNPYARGLGGRDGRDGIIPRVYASGIHAISAFMAGECQALAEDGLLLDRLLGLPEWRFYRPLDNALAADNDTPQIALRSADATSAAWLGEALRYWKIGGSLAQARARRAAEAGFEIGQLQNGFVCHS
jgi:polar amino acid transport system substrate-binding protein